MNTSTGPLAWGSTILAATLLMAGCGKAPDVAAPTASGSVTTDNVVDADVTTNVKTTLLRDAALKGVDINLITLNGDVRLIGVLDNQAQIDSAIQVARAADGVHSIHDELSVKK